MNNPNVQLMLQENDNLGSEFNPVLVFGPSGSSLHQNNDKCYLLLAEAVEKYVMVPALHMA